MRIQDYAMLYRSPPRFQGYETREHEDGVRSGAEDEGEERPEMDMDLDPEEGEADCTPSHTPARSRSPFRAAPPTIYHPHDMAVPPTISPLHPAAERGGEGDLDLDLAGVCFDPSGAWVYAASTRGVAEWGVRDAEKRWWRGGEWA